MADMPGPKISITTVVKNDAAGLEKTILSACGQQGTTPELIVVDGGSTDGTVAVIRRYQDKIAFWSSESDQGIYDAMNKGLDKASGEWVIFLNAGDVFSSDLTLRSLTGFPETGFSATGVIPGEHTPKNQGSPVNIREEADPGAVLPVVSDEKYPGIIYGDSIADYGSFRVYRAAGKPNNLWKGMFCNHQSMLFRREALLTISAGRDESGRLKCFSTNLRISADHDLVCRLYRSGVTFKQVAIPVAIWETGGLSNKMQVRSVIERYRMIRTWFHRGLKVRVYYLWLLFLAVLVEGMYRLLPLYLMKPMIRIANRKSLESQSKPGSR